VFGSITNFLSFPKNRKEMFDVAIAGPFLGFLTSLITTLIGLYLTQSASPNDLATYPALPTTFFTSSFLLFQLTDTFLHISQTVASGGALTSVHPLVAAGLIGLLANAFNFAPVGRLDGGRAFTAVFGRKSAQTISTVTLIAQAAALLIDTKPLSLFWILSVVLLQRGQDVPPIDDVTPVATSVDDSQRGFLYYWRMFAFGFCVFLAAAMLVPMPFDPSAIANRATQTISNFNEIGI
jgi:membrane-associated protease RseP (regulator of RpoE activity)